MARQTKGDVDSHQMTSKTPAIVLAITVKVAKRIDINLFNLKAHLSAPHETRFAPEQQMPERSSCCNNIFDFIRTPNSR